MMAKIAVIIVEVMDEQEADRYKDDVSVEIISNTIIGVFGAIQQLMNSHIGGLQKGILLVKKPSY